MSTINEDLEQIKYDEDNLASSKVARFCYTEQAYQDDDYEGVPEFDPSVEQNIPLANADTLKTNATVLDRGFRSQASSLPRMLINHFFGRVSYNLNKAHDNLVSLVTTIKNFIGQPNGIASLDENGRIPYSQLPESALNLKGDWDASTNTPELSDEMEGATLGDMYYVNVGGTVDFGHGEIAFLPNDRVMYNQYNRWIKLSAGNVRKVNNREPNASDGNVTVYGTDINVSEETTHSISEVLSDLVEIHNNTILEEIVGKNWTKSFASRHDGSSGNDSPRSVAVTKDDIITYQCSGNRKKYLESENTWQEINFVGFSAYVDNTWYFVSNTGDFFYSKDEGETLIPCLDSSGNAIKTKSFYYILADSWIEKVNDKLYAHFSEEQLLCSNDGISWDVCSFSLDSRNASYGNNLHTPLTNYGISAHIKYKDGIYITTWNTYSEYYSYAQHETYLYGYFISTDGINWTQVYDSRITTYNTSAKSIQVIGDYFYLFSSTGVFRSKDGQEMEKVDSLLDLHWGYLEMGNTGYIREQGSVKVLNKNGVITVVGASAKVEMLSYYSLDEGETWQQCSGYNTVKLESSFIVNDFIVCNVYDTSNKHYILISEDGINYKSILYTWSTTLLSVTPPIYVYGYYLFTVHTGNQVYKIVRTKDLSKYELIDVPMKEDAGRGLTKNKKMLSYMDSFGNIYTSSIYDERLIIL